MKIKYSYLFYHTGLLPNGGSYGRAASVEQFTYNADGTIPPVAMTKEGVKPVGALDPYKRVEAETMSWAEKCRTTQNDAVGVYVTSVRQKGYIRVREVDFGKVSPKTFSASLAAGLTGGILEVRLDDLKGALVASIQMSKTGGWEQFKWMTAEVKQQVTGKHDIYFCFNAQNVTTGRELFNFDYWMFSTK